MELRGSRSLSFSSPGIKGGSQALSSCLQHLPGSTLTQSRCPPLLIKLGDMCKFPEATHTSPRCPVCSMGAGGGGEVGSARALLPLPHASLAAGLCDLQSGTGFLTTLS